jgi:hypothetical protein
MRCSFAFLCTLAVISFLSAISHPAFAREEGQSFLIPASEGYGTEDCLVSKADCGRIIADSWCEAKGFGKSLSFGPALPEDSTASLSASKARSEPLISIRCNP